MASKAKSPQIQPGEGDHAADAKYREDLGRFQETHDVEELGREAREAVERNPEAYRAAEEAGKKGVAVAPLGPLPGEPRKRI